MRCTHTASAAGCDRSGGQHRKVAGHVAGNSQFFGLGSATAAGKLTVHWPTGEPRRESWDDLASDRYHTLVQGSGQP